MVKGQEIVPGAVKSYAKIEVLWEQRYEQNRMRSRDLPIARARN